MVIITYSPQKAASPVAPPSSCTPHSTPNYFHPSPPCIHQLPTLPTEANRRMSPAADLHLQLLDPSMATKDVKQRDRTWIPPPSSSCNSDVLVEEATNYHSPEQPPAKIGQSFNYEVHPLHSASTADLRSSTQKSEAQQASVPLDPSFKDPLQTTAEDEIRPLSTTHLPPQRTAYDFSHVDTADHHNRDLQSELFLLDQAMSTQQPPNSAVELDGSEQLFGAIGRSLFAPPIFDDANKLLPFEGAAEPTHPTSRLASHVTNHSGLQHLPKVADPSRPGAAFENVLDDIGYGIHEGETNRPYYGQEGPHQFGRQKKRRLSSYSSMDGFLPETLEGPMAKRAKSEIVHGSTHMYYPDRHGSSQFGDMPTAGSRTKGRAYSALPYSDPHFDDMGGGDQSPRVVGMYNSLTAEQQLVLEHLKAKISKYPRRKLRESLSQGVSIEEVEPLMSVNRDDLAEMLGLGVTTWKIFIHNSFGIPRWPARVRKSQEVKERQLKDKLQAALANGDNLAVAEIQQELRKLEETKVKNRHKLFEKARKCRVKFLAKMNKVTGKTTE